MPTLKQIQNFLAVARTGSVSKAAANLNLAQPALSMQIANLEAELGVRLFVRHSRGVELTEAGMLLADKAVTVLHMFDDMVSSIRTLQGQICGRVRIGMPTTTTAPMALPLMDVFDNDLPGVRLTIVEGMTGHLQHWLETGEIDLAILLVSPRQTNANHTILGRERLCLIGPRGDLNAPGNGISLAQSLSLPLIMVSPVHNLRRHLDSKADALGLSINIISEIDSLAQIKDIVSQGTAYTILPRSAPSPDWIGKSTGVWDIEGSEALLNLAVATSAAFTLSELHRPVLRTIKQLVQQLIVAKAWPGGEALDGMSSTSRTPYG